MENEKVINRINDYICSRVNEDGTIMNVRQFANGMGVHPNKIYTLLRGGSMPTLKTLMEIKRTYPTFNVDYVITGELAINEDAIVAKQIATLNAEKAAPQNTVLSLTANLPKPLTPYK
jgi:transcriptional regulator with XRE-family HTH domain